MIDLSYKQVCISIYISDIIYICMYVYIYIYVYVYLYIYIYMYIYIYTCIHIYIYIYVFIILSLSYSSSCRNSRQNSFILFRSCSIRPPPPIPQQQYPYAGTCQTQLEHAETTGTTGIQSMRTYFYLVSRLHLNLYCRFLSSQIQMIANSFCDSMSRAPGNFLLWQLSLGMHDSGDHGMGSLAELWFGWHSVRRVYTQS